MQPAKKILFIDDDLPFLETVERFFRLWTDGSVEIHLCHSPGQAVTLLQTHPIDLAVIDIRMPVVDGLQFLHLLHRKHPAIRKVVLTGYAEPAYRSACLDRGAELFLEKPRTSDEYDSVFAAIDALLRIPVEDGFHGALRKVDLHEILQLECLSRRSSLLDISSGRVRGRVYIKEGLVLHAETGQETGYDAFYHLMALRSGEFAIRAYEPPKEETIQGQWEFLLMESSRMRDEGSLENAPVEAPWPTLIPDVEIERYSPPGAPVARGTDTSRNASRPSRSAAAEPPPAAAPEPAPLPGPIKIEEVVVCAPDGTLKGRIDSKDPEMRLTLVEFTRFKQGQIAAGLPLGALRWMEAQTARELVVVSLSTESAMFVRSNNAPAEAVLEQAARQLAEALPVLHET